MNSNTLGLDEHENDHEQLSKDKKNHVNPNGNQIQMEKNINNASKLV